ncbi:hypothetical protein KUV89_03650 [Marinobacter hydrocarbonoclasticus]|nr:hypothetical protein [Marinobacter nauticus]
MHLSEFDIAVVLTAEAPPHQPQSVEATGIDATLELSLAELIDNADNWPGMVRLPQQLSA